MNSSKYRDSLMWVALFEARPIGDAVPQATLTYGQCALRLVQFKAVGLGEVFDLTTAPQSFSWQPPLFRENWIGFLIK